MKLAGDRSLVLIPFDRCLMPSQHEGPIERIVPLGRGDVRAVYELVVHVRKVSQVSAQALGIAAGFGRPTDVGREQFIPCYPALPLLVLILGVCRDSREVLPDESFLRLCRRSLLVSLVD